MEGKGRISTKLATLSVQAIKHQKESFSTRLIITILNLSANLISFMSHSVIIKHFGADATLDAINGFGSIPLACVGIFSAVVLYIFPTAFMQMSYSSQEETAKGIGLLSAIFLIFFTFAAGAVLGQLWSQHTTLLSVYFSIIAALIISTSLLNCLSQSRGNYLKSGFAGVIQNTGLMLGALIAIECQNVVLYLVGQIAGLLIALSYSFAHLKLKMTLNTDVLTLGLRTIQPMVQRGLMILIGVLGFTLFQPIDAILCSGLNIGSLNLMLYSQRVLVATSTVISFGSYQIAARSIYMNLNQYGADSVLRTVKREILRFIALGIFACLAFGLVGKFVLEILLAGAKFSDSDLEKLNCVVLRMLLGLGPMAATPYLFRVSYTFGDYKTPAVIGVTVPVIYVLCGSQFVHVYGPIALSYAYSISWWIGLILMTYLLSNKLMSEHKQIAKRSE